MANVLEVGGRRFVVPKDRTARNDAWIGALASEMGVQHLAKQSQESVDEFARRVMQLLAHDARTYSLLGGLVMPEGIPVTKWTPALAEETGEFLGNLTAPADKATVHSAVAFMVAGFFRNGDVSAVTSVSYSEQEAERGGPEKTVGATSAVTGPTSSARAQTTTLADTRSSRLGRFASFFSRSSHDTAARR